MEREAAAADKFWKAEARRNAKIAQKLDDAKSSVAMSSIATTSYVNSQTTISTMVSYGTPFSTI